ncbi:MAG: acyltransferase, partial [Vicinamibacterales bacterium]
LALVPGPPGIALRRAFYRLTLEACSTSFFVGFGALFTHRDSVVEQGAYVGPYALVGSARLGRGCLIGSRASLLSGPHLHQLDEEGRWMAADVSRRQQIQIGAHAWVGEGAVVMVDVGAGAMVAAGAVVSTPVPAGIVVAGNPARFVRRLSTCAVAKTPPESPV